MEHDVLEKNDFYATVKLSFTDFEFNAALAEAYRTIMRGKMILPDEVFLRFESLMERHPRNREFLQAAVSALLRRGYVAVAGAEGFPRNAAPAVLSASGDVDEGLTIVAGVDLLPMLDEPVYEGLTVSYSKVALRGDEVEGRLRDARKHYGVASNAELARRLGAYADEEEMVLRMMESLDKLVNQLNEEARRKALIEALLEKNPLTIPESVIEAHVDDVINSVRMQVGEGVFADAIGEAGGRDFESIRRIVRKEEEKTPHLEVVLDSIAMHLHLRADDPGRLRELDRQRNQAFDPKAVSPAEDMLAEIKKDGNALALLDRKVRQSMALDYAAERANYDCVGTVAFNEAAPRQMRF